MPFRQARLHECYRQCQLESDDGVGGRTSRAETCSSSNNANQAGKVGRIVEAVSACSYVVLSWPQLCLIGSWSFCCQVTHVLRLPHVIDGRCACCCCFVTCVWPGGVDDGHQ